MVSSSFLPGRGGIESYLAELCDLLAPRVAVLAAGERDGVPLPDDLGYPIHPYPGALLVPSRKAARAMVAAARAEGTDRVIFGTPWPLVLTAPLLRRAGLRHAVIVHGAEMLVPSAIPVVRRKLARALAHAELLLPVSHFTAARCGELLRRFGHEVPPMEVLRARVDLERFHPGMDTRAVRAKLGIDDAERVVLCFGRLVKRKGVHRMIEALPALRRRVPNTVLVVAGSGPEEKALRRAAAKTDGRVIFAGRVPEAEAPALYAAADVFALPVTDRWFGLEIEGLGVVLLEAAACGVPGVTGRSGGTPEAVLDGETGFVIDATDAGALTDRVAWLLEHPEDARRMGLAARSHVEREFSRRSLPQGLTDWLARSPSL
jgi:phosphatidylinositol alpha-1,6-mannosyltransferase